MLRQFLADSAIYGASALLVRAVGLILVPFYTRVLSPADYGTIDLISVFAALAAVTVALEIVQGLARYLGDAESDDDKAALSSTAFWFTVVAYTLFLGAALAFVNPLTVLLLGRQELAPILALALGSIWLNGVFYLLQSLLRWDLKPTRYAMASLAYTGASLVVSILLVLVVRMGVVGVFIGQMAGAAVGVAVSWQQLRARLRFRFERGRCIQMLKFSVPLIPSSLGVIVTMYIDRIAIRNLMTLGDVGLFGIGYRVASVSSLAMIGFQAALTPLVYQRYRDPTTPAELARIFRLFIAAAVLASATLALLAPEVLSVLVPADFATGARVVPFLAPALLLGGMYVFAPGLAIAKRTGVTAGINLVGAVTNTGLNFVLIPPFGIQGAAVATLTSSAGVFALYMVASQRTYPVPHEWKSILAATAMGVTAYVIGSQANTSSWTDIATKGAVLLALAASMVAVGLVRSIEIRQTVAAIGILASRTR